jgi:hypothetical protein
MGDLFTVPEESREVANVSKEDRLLETVLASGNIEVLERYIALRKSEEERQARIVFEEHFAKMQAALPVVTKRKENGGSKSKYAPIEDIQAQWDPIIRDHGFSYSWREEVVPEFDGKRILLDIMGYGHTKTNYFDSPRIDGNSAQNKIQVAGAMSTYGRRYTFVSGMGGRVEGEDSDANIPEDIELLASELRDIMATGKIIPETVEMIKKYLALPEEQWDIKRLQGWVKAARRKAAK